MHGILKAEVCRVMETRPEVWDWREWGPSLYCNWGGDCAWSAKIINRPDDKYTVAELVYGLQQVACLLYERTANMQEAAAKFQAYLLDQEVQAYLHTWANLYTRHQEWLEALEAAAAIERGPRYKGRANDLREAIAKEGALHSVLNDCGLAVWAACARVQYKGLPAPLLYSELRRPAPVIPGNGIVEQVLRVKLGNAVARIVEASRSDSIEDKAEAEAGWECTCKEVAGFYRWHIQHEAMRKVTRRLRHRLQGVAEQVEEVI